MKAQKSILILFLCCFIIVYLITGCNMYNSNVAKPSNLEKKSPEKSTVVSKGIDTLEKIEIGGVEQWIYIRSNDKTKPVLLFLHGGPGYAMMPLLHSYNSELEDHYVVVNWDQRGAGLSYSTNIPENSMTLKQFVSDVHELTDYMKSRFNKEKIYLIGHSFGTILGLKAISEYPEDYLAFIGVGQVVSFGENEQRSYDFALKSAQEDNNTRAIRQLTSVGRPDKNGDYNSNSGYEITMNWLEHYGGDLYGKSTTGELEEEIQDSEIYKGAGKKIEKGYEFSNLLFEDNEVLNINFKEQIKSVDVPVYFFSGKHDYDTPFELVEQYFNILTAPKKKLVWFDNSAHFPFYEEPSKFNRVMIDMVLPETLNSIDMTGRWTGSYSIGQVTATVELNVLKLEDGSYSAEFSFGPSDNNTDIPKGKYKMAVAFDIGNSIITLTGTEWIERPTQYEMVNLIGSVTNDSINGSVTLSDSTTTIGDFSLERAI